MKKDIKDYLHLYLGAGCIMKAGKGVTEDYYSTVEWADIGYPHNVKALVLRPLSDMRNDERVERGKHLLQFERWTLDGEYHRWMLSRGFDLFGLIEAGLAIDKTTLKQKV